MTTLLVSGPRGQGRRKVRDRAAAVELARLRFLRSYPDEVEDAEEVAARLMLRGVAVHLDPQTHQALRFELLP